MLKERTRRPRRKPFDSPNVQITSVVWSTSDNGALITFDTAITSFGGGDCVEFVDGTGRTCECAPDANPSSQVIHVAIDDGQSPLTPGTAEITDPTQIIFAGGKTLLIGTTHAFSIVA